MQKIYGKKNQIIIPFASHAEKTVVLLTPRSPFIIYHLGLCSVASYALLRPCYNL